MNVDESLSINWKRIYALPYNHYFKDKAKVYRSYLNIDVDGITDENQAWTWIENHLTQNKPSPVPWFELLEKQNQIPSNEKPWETKVPLWQAAFLLAHEFRLPYRMRNRLGMFIVTSNDKFLIGWRGLDIDFSFNIYAAELQLAIKIDGINVTTTKGQWDDIWNSIILPLKNRLGKPVPGNRALEHGKELQEEIERNFEWFELSETQGLGPTEALKRWESQEQHKNERGDYDLSTVTKAVQDFRRLISPIPV